jgi:hypothetical protein
VRQLPDSDTATPYYTPPVLLPRAPAYGAPAVQPAGQPPAQPIIGPDVSAEDAEAIRAAILEMEGDEAGRQLAAAHAAAAGVAGAAGTALPPLPAGGFFSSGGGAAPGGAPGGAAAAPAPGVPAVPQSPRSVEQAVRVASNSAELLSEMLVPLAAAAKAPGGDVSGVGEAFITDLADQCYRHRSVLSEVIRTCEDEALLSSALAANDELSRALTVFEELTAAHAGPGAVRSRPGSGAGAAGGGLFPSLPQSTGGAAGGAPQWGAPGAAGAAAAGFFAGAGGSGGGGVAPMPPAAAHFSLLDEGEEEEAQELVTNRSAARKAPPGAAAPLIDLGEVDPGVGGGVGAGGSSSGGATAAGAGVEGLEEGVGKLGLGGDKAAQL